MDLFSYLLGKNSSGGGGGGSGGLDWSAIGYSGAPQAIVDGYNYAKQIYDNWDNTIKDMGEIFRYDKNLIYFPLVDTSNVTNMRYMFLDCNNLTAIPVLNTSNVTTMKSAFQSNNLTDESIDNILQMCINATSYTGTKTLQALSFNKNVQTVERIQALPHYQDFINAGWTIGY